ncbi:MAG: 50S ribosomal protein L31 [Patescibacteria group bacterium]|nr:50S ribosomal protein L31 [Patescibacteria group bacterium]
MKQGVHPKYNTKAVITCACGSKFQSGSTRDTIQVELCSACHPFYTGKQKLVDTENLVKKFEEKKKAAQSTKVVNKKVKREKRRAKVTSIKGGKKVTLKDMLKDLQNK